MTLTKQSVSLQEASEALAKKGRERFIRLFEHGTLELELYAPCGHDPQQPHTRDEVYIIVSGRGTFFRAGEREAFGPGDFLFVAAGVEHRFEDFSDDFATWVLFYGPEGGEV